MLKWKRRRLTSNLTKLGRDKDGVDSGRGWMLPDPSWGLAGREEELSGTWETRCLLTRKNTFFSWAMQLFIIEMTRRIKGWMGPTSSLQLQTHLHEGPRSETFPRATDSVKLQLYQRPGASFGLMLTFSRKHECTHAWMHKQTNR